MEELIEEYKESIMKTQILHARLWGHKDGFIYKVDIHRYGENDYYEYPNSFLVEDVMNDYYGDNGIVILETNNEEFAEKMRGHPSLSGIPITIIK
jgi:hypothetical protein